MCHLVAGWKQRDVAVLFDVSQSIISKLRLRYRDTHDAKDRPRSGRPRITTDSLRNRRITARSLQLSLLWSQLRSPHSAAAAAQAINHSRGESFVFTFKKYIFRNGCMAVSILAIFCLFFGEEKCTFILPYRSYSSLFSNIHTYLAIFIQINIRNYN